MEDTGGDRMTHHDWYMLGGAIALLILVALCLTDSNAAKAFIAAGCVGFAIWDYRNN